MKDRKDEFLIIRVPKTLKDKLIALAKKRGIKHISKLVREILDEKV